MKKVRVKIIREQFKFFEKQLEEYINKGYEIQGNIIIDKDDVLYAILICNN